VPAAPFIGLTGAVAAGKTEALTALGRLGLATLSADAVVHDLLASERVKGMLVDRWGAEVERDGGIDRARVGTIVFERPEELDWLERALHRWGAVRIWWWRAGLPADTAAVVEVPLLFETEMDSAFDATICIVAADRSRAERAGARGITELESRTGRQLSQDEKAARATFVVRNDGTIAELERALAELLARIGGAGAPS
jgi:dephospho-CoA kinase